MHSTLFMPVINFHLQTRAEFAKNEVFLRVRDTPMYCKPSQERGRREFLKAAENPETFCMLS